MPAAHAPDNADCFTAPPVPASESPTTNLGLSGLEDAMEGLSSSEEKANLGMVSRLRVLGSAVGLRLRSCLELEPDVQERRLRGKSRRAQDNPRWARGVALSRCSTPGHVPLSPLSPRKQHKPSVPPQTRDVSSNPWSRHKPLVLAQALGTGISPQQQCSPPCPHTGAQCPLDGSCPRPPSAGPIAPLCHRSDSGQTRRG